MTADCGRRGLAVRDWSGQPHGLKTHAFLDKLPLRVALDQPKPSGSFEGGVAAPIGLVGKQHCGFHTGDRDVGRVDQGQCLGPM